MSDETQKCADGSREILPIVPAADLGRLAHFWAQFLSVRELGAYRQTGFDEKGYNNCGKGKL